MVAMTSETTNDVWSTAPGPCIGVCEYAKPRKDGTRRCKGCRMTRPEKQRWNVMDVAEKPDWVAELMRRLAKKPKRLRRWERRYRAKCEKRGVPCPLDEIRPVAGRRDRPAA